MEELNIMRLKKERTDWRNDRPYGFSARPSKKEDGTLDLYKWECDIPGPADSPWEGGVYRLHLEFPHEYPAMPPRCVFKKKLFHPNIYPSGAVCLSIINEEEDWRPTLKIKDILVGIQSLLKYPNEKSPAQKEAYQSYVNNKKDYYEKVKAQANECKPTLAPIRVKSKENGKVAEKKEGSEKASINI